MLGVVPSKPPVGVITAGTLRKKRVAGVGKFSSLRKKGG